MSYREEGYLQILVIDDDAEMRTLISKLLLTEGHQVIAESSAEAGLEQLPYFTFDVAFLDHNLPGMEGLVLGEYLRSNNPRMEIALVTGSADEQIERMTKEHGIHLITKPFELERLLDVTALAIAGEDERIERAKVRASDHYHVSVVEHHGGLKEHYSLPNLPSRIEDRLAQRIRASLDALRFGDGCDEGERLAAYAGLLTAQVLGIKLPRHKDGRSYFEYYDALMTRYERAKAFTP